MAVEFKDYYKILGVDRKADDKTIKSAFRRLARKHHPDVAKSKDAGERFKEINEAYEVLSDPDKKRKYDTLGPNWWEQFGASTGTRRTYSSGGRSSPFDFDSGGTNFSDFFETLFGRSSPTGT